VHSAAVARARLACEVPRRDVASRRCASGRRRQPGAILSSGLLGTLAGKRVNDLRAREIEDCAARAWREDGLVACANPLHTNATSLPSIAWCGGSL